MGESTNRCSIHYFLYSVQIFVICVAISVSVFKLFSTETDSQFWVSMFSSCVGYVLPNPTPNCKCDSRGKTTSAHIEEEEQTIV